MAGTAAIGADRGSSRALDLLAVAVVVLAALLIVVGFLPEDAPREGVVHDLPAVEVHLDEALLADIAAYRAPRRVASLVSLLLGVAVPTAVGLALLTGRRRRGLERLRVIPHPGLQVGVAGASIVLLAALARLPVVAWSGVVHDGRWGFRTSSVAAWALDHAAVVGARALGPGALVTVVAVLMLRRPRTWPALVTLLVATVGPLALLLHPVVVHPVLLPTAPLPDGPHRDAIEVVVARSTVDVPVLVGEASRRTTRRNAVATGLGPTARVVVHDTFLELPPREVAAIVAHELAHLERRDPLRAALAPVPVVALLALIGRRMLRGRDAPDVRTMVAVVALLLALDALATPVRAGAVRTIEQRTDARSAVLADDPEALVAVLASFVVDGLADPDPPRWSVLLWGTHPVPADRVATAGGAFVSGAGDPARR